MAKDILKEAIADAKAVREVALANAKAALEEAFTPRLQSMLSAKLSEELNEEEDLDETYMEDEKEDVKEMYDEDEKDMDEAYMEDEKEDLDEEIDLEEILAELELEESEEVSEDTVDEAKKDDDDKMEEAKHDDKDDVKEAKDEDKDDMKEAKHDDDDVKKEAKDDDEKMKKEELDEMGRPVYKAEEANYAGYTADRVHEDKEFDLDALLEEINNLDEEKEDEVNEEVEETNEIAVTSALVGGLAGIIIGGTPLVAAKAAYDMVSPEKKEEMMKKYPKLTKLMDTLGVIGKAAGDARRSESISEAEKAASEDDLEKMEKALMGEDTQAEEIAELKAALEVKTNELNEVNLLNSKLLYVNRIFKANNLDEAQKLRVVETLDNATNVKEAKLIYETIKDTFTISKENKTTPKRSIKEGLGMASKAAGTSTAPKKEAIIESTDMVARMQKLANIKINQ